MHSFLRCACAAIIALAKLGSRCVRVSVSIVIAQHA